jgi:hypothetical protein
MTINCGYFRDIKKCLNLGYPPRIHKRKFEGSELVRWGITTTKNVQLSNRQFVRTLDTTHNTFYAI